MTGVAETAPSDTVDETIRLNHYERSTDNHGEYLQGLSVTREFTASHALTGLESSISRPCNVTVC